MRPSLENERVREREDTCVFHGEVQIEASVSQNPGPEPIHLVQRKAENMLLLGQGSYSSSSLTQKIPQLFPQSPKSPSTSEFSLSFRLKF